MAPSTSTAELLPTSAEALAEDSQSLISLPEVYMRLREVMDAGDSSMQDVADVIALDPALTARLLRIANSALYNFPSKVETLSRAAGILGLRQIHDLVLAASVARAFVGLPNDVMDMLTFWHRSVHRGFLAKELGSAAGLRDTESLFIRGLLLDLGHLILYHHYPQACRQALAASGDDLAALLAAEQRLIGCDALSLGAELMRAWRMPPSYIASFEQLNAPEHAADQAEAVAVLHLAAHLTHGLDTDRLLSEILDAVPPAVWELTGLSPEAVTARVDNAAEDVIESMYKVFAGPA
ncbi:MAG: hypothetical protein RLZ44_852 [Pseudomonadota bacterium]|jgi:HD-like signal output (HDOD) protein